VTTVIGTCPKCGGKILSDAPEGLCPKCVLKSALGNFPDVPVAAGHDGSSAQNETNAGVAHTKKATRAADLLGELGNYELLEEVGRGGQGVVFRARQKSLNRIVALKVILEGSVQRSADRVRINVQLINAQTDFHLWAETYDRELTDIFGVESEIAKGIAKTLRVRLPEAERQQLAKRPTENLKAYQYYLQGRLYRHRNTREDLFTATRYFERALEEDRNYSLAYAGLADAYGALGLYAYIAPIEGRRKEEEAARKALAVDENLAEAHAALGQAQGFFAPCNFSLGDGELRRAIELSPSLAIAHSYLGVSLVRQGRFDESIAENLKAREFDPLSSIIARTMALPYHLKRDYARALELLRQANELGPSFITTWEIGIYIQNKLFNETLAELEKAKRERKNDSILIYDTGMVYAAQGGGQKLSR
jgi:tetratricopeptide (TPR) repeat protein